MFKPESYITPLILSYVDKYIKNFRPEDSQVSLWCGDASFHNLDLRLDVLEHELQLPFSLVSGHIHELLIHVPWTKLTSEPISITINTIECVLKVRGHDNSNSDGGNVAKEPKRKTPNRRQEIAAPPGIVQSLINKIVSNIVINCNNLILKYVEEDIVMSVNIKLLTFESANEKWQASFVDLSLIIRKLITLSDLTVCLDKRNAAGKIEVYQEPMLYRCFVQMRLLREYHSPTAEKAANTRLDIHCNKMEFSMTEQQVPMLMRMIVLLWALHQRQLKYEPLTDSNDSGGEEGEASGSSDTWTGWAWNFASFLLPLDMADPLWPDENEQPYPGHTLQIGTYIDNATFTLKVSERYSSDRGMFSTKKVKHWPLLYLQLNGCFIDTVIGGIEWCSAQMGIAEVLLVPKGFCSCGQSDLNNIPVTYYIKAGVNNENYKVDSLFDSNRDEKKSRRKNFRVSWQYYLSTVTEAVMHEKTPAIAFDYLYHLESSSVENLSELSSDLEYSNLPEKSLCRLVSGPLVMHVCSGFVHRMSTVLQIMEAYDYAPYKERAPEPELWELLPPSADDFDALSNDIPTRTYRITFRKPVFELQLIDHPKFSATADVLFRKPKKISQPAHINVMSVPKMTMECDKIDVTMLIPMYSKRLVHTTCQLPDPPVQMFNACYTNASINLVEFSSQLIFNPSNHTTILLPFNITCTYKSIIFPKYWIDPDISHKEIIAEIDNITLTGTKAKLMLMVFIIDKYVTLEASDYRHSVLATSLIQDASKYTGMVILELYGEQLKWKKISTISTHVHDLSLNSFKAFIMEPNEVCLILRDMKSGPSQNIPTRLSHRDNQNIREPNQVLIVSGPDFTESETDLNDEEPVLFTLTIQYPNNPQDRIHPPLILFSLREIKVCLDPLAFRWLLYHPRTINLRTETLWNTVESIPFMSRAISEASGSVHETPRRAPTPHESVHSNSDRDHNIHISPSTSKVIEDELPDNNKTYSYSDITLKWYPMFTNMMVFGDIAPCTIYFPTQSLSTVGFPGIQGAIEMSLAQDSSIEIMILKLPNISIRSAAQKQSLKQYSTKLPIKVPEIIWTPDKQCFPWSISVRDLCCFTLQNETKLTFLKPVSGNATIGLSVKYKVNEETQNIKEDSDIKDKKSVKHNKNADIFKSNTSSNASYILKSTDNISSLGICVHIDNSPVVISLSEMQVCLMTSILSGVFEAATKIMPNLIQDREKFIDVNSVNIPRKSQSRSQSPSFYKENFPDIFSEKTPSVPSETVNADEETDTIKFTTWIQWTFARLSVKVYAHSIDGLSNSPSAYLDPPTLKLVFDLEDIMSSLDLQQVYMKFKSKVVTVGIQHFRRNNGEWKPGPYLGLVMRGREELPTNDRQDNFGFMSVTITRAKCGHVHYKWGTARKHRLSDAKIEQHSSETTRTTRYISEVVATLQPIDIIISSKTLKSFYMVLEPIVNLLSTNDPTPKQSSKQIITYINNANLPLAYLECHGLRIIMPSSELNEKPGFHDVCIIEIENINLTPLAENPICRVPVRPDIYQHAAQNRILNVPGSEIEDRQYQLNVNCLSVNTGSWNEFSQFFNRETTAVSSLHTMNENPALEWNNLGSDNIGLMPQLTLLPIIQKFNLCIVAAPAIVYKENILVCGNSMEINCVSDIAINISLRQISLLSALSTELLNLFESVRIEPVTKRPKFTYLCPKPHRPDLAKSEIEQVSIDLAKDSGVETADVNSEITAKTKESVTFSGSTEIDKRNILKLYSESKSSDRSLCVKSTSVVSSNYNTLNNCPFEVLVTGGQISVSFYKIIHPGSIDIKVLQKSRKEKASTSKKVDEEYVGYEASEEGSVEEIPSVQKIQPFLFISISQPNILFSRITLNTKINFSCFDICLKTNSSECSYIEGIPTKNDYPVYLLETKPGVSNPDTGVPPAFLTMKWIKGFGKLPSIDLEFGRPIKIVYSLALWNFLTYVKENISNSFYDGCRGTTISKQKLDVTKSVQKTEITRNNYSANNTETYSKYKLIKNLFWGINNFKLKFSQIVFIFKTELESEMTLSLRKLKSYLSFSNRPERITNLINWENFAINVNTNDSTKFLLNPWSCNVDASLFWETWQSSNDDPQIQILINSDQFIIDVGPEQVKCAEAVLKECNDLLRLLTNVNTSEKSDKTTANIERDQHYKDDLRAGAFKFVDATGNVNELPLPYQVMFWNESVAAMSWRYPQPRILNKVRVFPVPFKNNHDRQDEQVFCFLEYWSDCHNSYQPYTNFQLSESEMCHLDLRKCNPQPAVSCTWRVVLSGSDYKPEYSKSEKSDVFISPRALAACMRIDSYFNPVLIPRLQLVLKLSSLRVSFYNQFNKNLPLAMPKKLNNFTPDGLIPDNQCFLIFDINDLIVHVSSWNSGAHLYDIQICVKSDVLDYSSLTLQPLIMPFKTKLILSYADSMNVDIISDQVTIQFSPVIGHTLGVSTQVWEQNWQTNVTEPPDMLILTRYVVCNDTNVKIRFGQVGTDEDILLPSRFLHLYSWRSQKYRRMIRIGVEHNGWIWSKPLIIDTDTSKLITVRSENRMNLIMTVKSLSATQKQIIFSGQLVICNMLVEHFELKLVSLSNENKDAELKNAQSYIVGGKNSTSSFLLSSKNKLALRLKFFNLESAWSGDIPLEENSKANQPWLVKIPLRERGQFLSIWCKIFTQRYEDSSRILIMLWPLFMVRSNLPINTKLHIETPLLKVHLETMVRGRGELQQLYCPGTIDHSHNLTFQLDTETPSSDTHIPLNYSLVDRKQFFKKSSNENIDEILEFLKDYDDSKWPYIDSVLDNTDWIVEEQPLTHVQIRYQNVCRYSSSLLVELLPWCIILNTLGCSIAIITNGKELCRVSHHGIVTPPKLENTFNIGVGFRESWNISPLLQLSKPDWSQSFYMPKINGLIPLDGNIRVPVKCGAMIRVVSITSNVLNEIRILQVSSSHIITNHTNFQLNIECLIVPDNGKAYEVPPDVMRYSFTLPSHLDKNNIGKPIAEWYAVDDISDSISDYTLHIVITMDNKLIRSCPVRVDKGFIRKNICLYYDSCNIPLVLISQEQKGQTYLSVHHDYHPQLLIKNKSAKKIYCAQCDINGVLVLENPQILWMCKIDVDNESYYTMPCLTQKFPDVESTTNEFITFSIAPEDSNIVHQWSQPVNINNFNEQYIRIPQYGDVKLTIEKISYTILIDINSVTEVEINARDIRSRLYLQSKECETSTISSDDDLHLSKEFLVLKIEQTNSPMNIQNTGSSNCGVNIKQLTHTNLSVNLENSLLLRDSNQECLKLKKKEWTSLNVAVFVKSIIFKLMSDEGSNAFEQHDIAVLTCDNVALTLVQNEGMDSCLTISEIQCDNQLFSKGCYDFPVLLIGDNTTQFNLPVSLNTPVMKLIEEARSSSLLTINLHIEIWQDCTTEKRITEIQDVKINIGPVLAYIEDTYLTKLLEYVTDLSPTKLVMWSLYKKPRNFSTNSHWVGIAEHLSWEAKVLAKPLILKSLSIEQLSVLLSVHSSVKLYIALDRSPLQFSRFERRNLITTPYRLGHALTMHYLSGAIFGAGWVVGSLELLGSPSGLARTLGTGLRDFISLPYHGLIQGPWAFLVGITHGSASLMRHITAGTLDSVTKLAASVARNLDRLTMDEEHQRRTEELRRQRPQGVAQGFVQGLTGLGISLLGAVGGIAHHPLQSVMNDGASPRGLVAGVGLGIVGVFTKPLSGAAELLALTGQGLLQGAGWNPLPLPRSHLTIHHTYLNSNSILKYKWKFLQSISLQTNLLAVIDAIYENAPVALVLSVEALVIIDLEGDVIQRIVALNEISGTDDICEPDILRIILVPPVLPTIQNAEVGAIEMDPVCRARVEDYVKNASGLIQLPLRNSTPDFSEMDLSPGVSPVTTPTKEPNSPPSLTFRVSFKVRNYFRNILTLAKEQCQDNTFKIL